MEWIKKILENTSIKDNKLDIESLMKSINDEFPNQAVSKVDFDNIQNQLTTANKTIKNLKNGNTDDETLQKTIRDHETEITTLKNNHKAEVEKLKKINAIDNLLFTNKANHPDLLKLKFDLAKVKMKDDGTVDLDGLTEQLTSMKETYKDMFDGNNQQEGDEPTYKYIPGDTGNKDSTNDSNGFVDIIKANQSRR